MKTCQWWAVRAHRVLAWAPTLKNKSRLMRLIGMRWNNSCIERKILGKIWRGSLLGMLLRGGIEHQRSFCLRRIMDPQSTFGQLDASSLSYSGWWRRMRLLSWTDSRYFRKVLLPAFSCQRPNGAEERFSFQLNRSTSCHLCADWEPYRWW